MTRSIINAPCRVAVAAILTATLLLATTDMARAETVEESELRAAAGSGNTGEVERLLAEGKIDRPTTICPQSEVARMFSMCYLLCDIKMRS